MGYAPDMGRFMRVPIDVLWGPWRSDTFRMQSDGWKFHVMYEQHTMYYRLILSHGSWQVVSITEDIKFHTERGAPIRINGMHSDVHIHHVQNMDSYTIAQLDMTPSYKEIQVTSILDLLPGRVMEAEPDTSQFIIDKADMSVIDHLQNILEGQQGKQAELRAKRRGEIDVNERLEVKLQIIA